MKNNPLDHDQASSSPSSMEPKLENGGHSSTPQQDLERQGDSDLMPVPSLVLSNGIPDPVASTTAQPEGGWIAWMAGIISGRLTDAGYFRITTIIGAFLVVFGTFMTSLSQTYWQILLAQGLCTGLGNGLLLTPMMTLITTYFKRRLPLVMGIAACGSTTGGLIYPSMARMLLPTIGFGWTMRAMGFIQLGTFAIALVSGVPRQSPRKSGPIIDWSVFGEAAFTLYLLGAFLAFLGVFFPFFFLSSYAREKQGLSYIDSLNLTLVLNGIGFPARLIPSFIARHTGTMNVFIAFLFSSALCGVQSLFLAVVTIINSDMSKIGARLGIISAGVGIGALLGSPISGAIISASGGSYVGAQIFSGSTLVVGGLFVLASREMKRRQEGQGLWMKL
ncbi:hypothetical protein FOXB_16982 [Fusarium oxysporum f. sp. conglutinans Fo5176]|uniref:Major facilitator superfamily (MFS) profile domain-containing protein n=1 Tax=Fusarium oxysporum (strain Fo5176) TaxID=660025 RepID=F9GE98_FUSOF|nr:hypothetical protein FOXB_16982 [Fusarium oxysporum f. sp. conglutinans Fo5176]